MNMNDILDFISDGATLAQIDELKNAATKKGKELREANKAAEKDEKAARAVAGEAMKDEIKVGSIVRFTYGSGKAQTVLEAEVIKMTEKTFHVQLDGKEKATWRYFSQLVEIVSTPGVVEAPVAE